MAEASNEKLLPGAKAERYAALAGEIAAVLEGEPNLTARMATVVSMLANSFDHYFWTGFYLVDPGTPDELVVGPYQGALGRLRIAFGRGGAGRRRQRAGRRSSTTSMPSRAISPATAVRRARSWFPCSTPATS